MFKAFHSSAPSAIWSSLGSNISALTRKSRPVQRASKTFSPEKFLLSLLGDVSTGKASFSQLVITIGHGSPLRNNSPLALHQRITRSEFGAESFLIFCLIHICQLKCGTFKATSTCVFKPILVEDSTFIRFPRPIPTPSPVMEIPAGPPPVAKWISPSICRAAKSSTINCISGPGRTKPSALTCLIGCGRETSP